MANAILNFHFYYLHTFLRTKEVTFNFFRISQQGYQVYRLVIQLPMLLITFLVQSCTISPMAVPEIFLLDVCVPTILLILRSCVKTVMDIGMKCPWVSVLEILLPRRSSLETHLYINPSPFAITITITIIIIVIFAIIDITITIVVSTSPPATPITVILIVMAMQI